MFFNLARIAFINVFFSFCSTAQIATPVFKHFTTEDGLPSSQVYQAMQDADGYMWFATDRGVVKFNGYEFKTFTTKEGLTDNVVFDLFQDDKKRIWMISFSGRIFIYDNNKITAYKYNSIIKDLVKGSVQLEISVDSLENVFVGSVFGEFLIDRNGILIQKFKIYRNILANKLLIDDMHDYNQPVALGSVTNLNYPTYLFHLTKSGTDSIRFLSQQHGRIRAVRLKNNVLLITIGNTLYEFKNKSIIQLTKLSAEVMYLYEDAQQRLWVCTIKGLYLFYKAGNYIESKYYLTDKYIGSIIGDKEGGYWITTIDDGVYYLINDKVKNFISHDHLKSPLTLTKDKFHIYAGYFSGSLAKINTNELNKIIDDSSGKYIDCLFYDTVNARLYIGNDRLRYLYNNVFYPIASSSVNVAGIGFVKNRHGIFSGAFGTLFKITADSPEQLATFKTRINCIYTNLKDELFLGCIDGAYKFDEANKSIVLVDEQLKDVRVDDIESINGNLCFATQGNGLMILMKDSTFITIDESQGLCNNIIRKLLVSGNKIWCASYNGISEINFTDFKNFKFNITNIRTNEGIISNEINDLTLLNDTVWVASKKGISFFHANTDFVNHAPPLVSFTSFRVNNVDTIVKDDYRFSHTLNTVSIGFESPLFKSDGKQTYEYILTNADDSIRGKTTSREVEFLSLKSGSYAFYVKAMNNSGVFSTKPATISFTILAPWWQTWWFRIIVLFALVGSGIVFYRNRVRKLKEKFNIEKNQATLQLTAMRAQMNPHFIFNVMSSIRSYMEKNDNASAEKYLTSFAKLIRYTLEKSEIQEVTVEEEIQAVRNYALLEMERFEHGFDFEVQCDENVDMEETMMPSLLLQPFVENAIKHGIDRLDRRGKILIEIKKINDSVLIAIEDNGVGRHDASDWNAANRTNHTSHGSKLTFERIVAFNKAFNKNIKVRMIDLTDSISRRHGTRVEIFF